MARCTRNEERWYASRLVRIRTTVVNHNAENLTTHHQHDVRCKHRAVRSILSQRILLWPHICVVPVASIAVMTVVVSMDDGQSLKACLPKLMGGRDSGNID